MALHALDHIAGGRWSRRSSKSARARVVARPRASRRGQGQRAEGQDLVHLRGVETAGRRSPRRSPRVVEDDRGGQHQFRAIRRHGQYGQVPVFTHRATSAPPTGADPSWTGPAPAGQTDQAVRGDQGVGQAPNGGPAARAARCGSPHHPQADGAVLPRQPSAALRITHDRVSPLRPPPGCVPPGPQVHRARCSGHGELGPVDPVEQVAERGRRSCSNSQASSRRCARPEGLQTETDLPETGVGERPARCAAATGETGPAP